MKQLLEVKAEDFIRRAENIGLKINTSKTNAMHIGNRSNTPHNPLLIFGEPVHFTDCFKFLGREIMCNQSLGEHVSTVEKKLINTTRLFNILGARKSKLNVDRQLMNYKTLHRSKLDYANSTILRSSKFVMRKITSLHNQPIRKCLGVPRNTLTQALYVLAAELPPEKNALLATCTELAKIFAANAPVKDYITFATKITTSYDVAYGLFKHILDHIIPISNDPLLGNITVCDNILDGLGSRLAEMSDEDIHSKFDDELAFLGSENFNIFATDASIENNISGIAVTTINGRQTHQRQLKIERKLPSKIAELVAIKEAFSLAVSLNMTKIAIFSDSKQACKAVQMKERNFITEEIYKISNSNNMETRLIWCPGHRGLHFNELADGLASLARTHGRTTLCGYTKDEAKTAMRDEIWSNWQTEFSHPAKRSLFHDVFPNIERRPWFHKKKLKPYEVKIINRLLVDRSYCKVNLHKWKRADNPICERCNSAPETAQHILFECQQLNNSRNNFTVFTKHDNVKQFLVERDDKEIREMLDFIDANKIKI